MCSRRWRAAEMNGGNILGWQSVGPEEETRIRRQTF